MKESTRFAGAVAIHLSIFTGMIVVGYCGPDILDPKTPGDRLAEEEERREARRPRMVPAALRGETFAFRFITPTTIFYDRVGHYVDRVGIWNYADELEPNALDVTGVIGEDFYNEVRNGCTQDKLGAFLSDPIFGAIVCIPCNRTIAWHDFWATWDYCTEDPDRPIAGTFTTDRIVPDGWWVNGGDPPLDGACSSNAAGDLICDE